MRHSSLAVGFLAFALIGCSGSSPRQQAQLAEIQRETREYQAKAKELIEKHFTCLRKEAEDKRLDRLDLETAAHAITASCLPIDQQFRTLSRAFHRENMWIYEAAMKGREEKDFDFAKKLIALKRAYG